MIKIFKLALLKLDYQKIKKKTERMSENSCYAIKFKINKEIEALCLEIQN